MAHLARQLQDAFVEGVARAVQAAKATLSSMGSEHDPSEL
jgi:hypothetical protein